MERVSAQRRSIPTVAANRTPNLKFVASAVSEISRESQNDNGDDDDDKCDR